MKMSLQPLFFAFILMAASISAMRVQVTAKWGDNLGERTSKFVEISDSRADSVVTGMAVWSGGRYQARLKTETRRGAPTPPIIFISPVRDASGSREGHAMVAEMQTLMRQNANSRSPSPPPGSGVNSAPKKNPPPSKKAPAKKAPAKKTPAKKAPAKKAPAKKGKRSYYLRSRYSNH